MNETMLDNRIIDSNDDQDVLEYKYNFVNTPWDDRSTKSKAGIVILLISIFVATMAAVMCNLAVHFERFHNITKNDAEVSCFKLTAEENHFVARIHSVATQNLVCVGAVVSLTSVLASGVCVTFQPLYMYIGNPNDYRCDKRFAIDVFESVSHEELTFKRLILLSSQKQINACAQPIIIGENLYEDELVTVIGRSSSSTGRSLSKQFITMKNFNEITKLNSNTLLCLSDIMRCPVRAGDLLIQRGKLIGLATTSTDRNKVACFSDLSLLKAELLKLDDNILYS